MKRRTRDQIPNTRLHVSTKRLKIFELDGHNKKLKQPPRDRAARVRAEADGSFGYQLRRQLQGSSPILLSSTPFDLYFCPPPTTFPGLQVVVRHST